MGRAVEIASQVILMGLRKPKELVAPDDAAWGREAQEGVREVTPLAVDLCCGLGGSFRKTGSPVLGTFARVKVPARKKRESQKKAVKRG